MHEELAAKLAAIEAIRATIGGAAADAAIVNLYAEYGQEAPTHTTPSPPRVSQSTYSITALDGSKVSNIQMITAGVYMAAPKNETEHTQQEALTRYLHTVAGLCSTLKLGALDDTNAITSQGFQLAHVYIGVHTTSRSDPDNQESPPLGALQAVQQSRCTLLLGAPGYGKSTFVEYLTLKLAQIALKSDPAAAMQQWPERNVSIAVVQV